MTQCEFQWNEFKGHSSFYFRGERNGFGEKEIISGVMQPSVSENENECFVRIYQNALNGTSVLLQQSLFNLGRLFVKRDLREGVFSFKKLKKC